MQSRLYSSRRSSTDSIFNSLAALIVNTQSVCALRTLSPMDGLA
jgi:hypothetical protein